MVNAKRFQFPEAAVADEIEKKLPPEQITATRMRYDQGLPHRLCDKTVRLEKMRFEDQPRLAEGSVAAYPLHKLLFLRWDLDVT